MREEIARFEEETLQGACATIEKIFNDLTQVHCLVTVKLIFKDVWCRRFRSAHWINVL